jgi:hypothetical protein
MNGGHGGIAFEMPSPPFPILSSSFKPTVIAFPTPRRRLSRQPPTPFAATVVAFPFHRCRLSHPPSPPFSSTVVAF